MDILHIILTSLGSIVVLFILTKLMGYRQMSQLSMFDYINGITIGSIAAEMATSLEDSVMPPVVAMIVYALVAILLSTLSEKSIFLRRFIVGKSIILLNNGKLYYKNLKKARLDLGEFLIQCRINGYYDLGQLQTIILEPNGNLSFLPDSRYRPATPDDHHMTPEKETVAANIIIDGRVMKENLRHTGNDEKWLKQQLKANGLNDVSEVLLATCDANNTCRVYPKINKTLDVDIVD